MSRLEYQRRASHPNGGLELVGAEPAPVAVILNVGIGDGRGETHGSAEKKTPHLLGRDPTTQRIANFGETRDRHHVYDL